MPVGILVAIAAEVRDHGGSDLGQAHRPLSSVRKLLAQRLGQRVSNPEVDLTPDDGTRGFNDDLATYEQRWRVREEVRDRTWVSTAAGWVGDACPRGHADVLSQSSDD